VRRQVSAANPKERANARRAAATTGDEDEMQEDNRTHARTARATKRDGNRTRNRALPLLPTDADQELPTPSDPIDLKTLSQ
jgi:hypothetical protein